MADSKAAKAPEPEPETAQALQDRVDRAVWEKTHDKDGKPVPIGGGAPTHR